MLDKIKEENSTFILRFIGSYALLLFTALGIAPWVPSKITFPVLQTPVSLLLILWLVWFWRSSIMKTKNKSIFISFVTAAYFMLSTTALFSHSTQSFKIATPVAKWLKEKHLDTQEILVYNKRLPSLAFEMNRSIISLYDGDRSLNREVQFEKDGKWKKLPLQL